MGEPAAEFLPRCSELVPRFFRQSETVFFVLVEHFVELPRDGFVDDDGVGLVVPTQRPRIEVGTADGAKTTIDGDDFRVVEAWLVHPNLNAAFHQFVDIVENAVGRERNVALRGNHDFDLHAALDGLPNLALELAVDGQIGVDEFDAVLRVVDGVIVEFADDFVRRAGFAVDDADGGVGAPLVPPRRGYDDVFAGRFLPDSGKNFLQGANFASLDSAVHIAPRTDLFGAVDVVVGHVHTADVGNAVVDDNDFAVVTRKNVVDPRKIERVELVNLDSALAKCLQMVLFQRLVVRGIAKRIEQRTNFDALGGFFRQKVEQKHGDGVVSEVEIFEIHAAMGFANGLKHIVELLLSALQ